jgi:hypothetical protein
MNPVRASFPTAREAVCERVDYELKAFAGSTKADLSVRAKPTSSFTAPQPRAQSNISMVFDQADI